MEKRVGTLREKGREERGGRDKGRQERGGREKGRKEIRGKALQNVPWFTVYHVTMQ